MMSYYLENAEQLLPYELPITCAVNKLNAEIKWLSPNPKKKEKNVLHKTKCRFCRHYPCKIKCKMET